MSVEPNVQNPGQIQEFNMKTNPNFLKSRALALEILTRTPPPPPSESAPRIHAKADSKVRCFGSTTKIVSKDA